MDYYEPELGKSRQVFRSKSAMIRAGTLISLLLVFGGLSLAAYAVWRMERRPMAPKRRAAKYSFVVGLFGVAIPVGGVSLLWWTRRLGSRRIVLFDRGFSFTDRSTTDVCQWSQVQKIHEIVTEEELNLLPVPGTGIRNVERSLVVFRDDGKSFRFSDLTVERFAGLADCLQAARDEYGFEWERIDKKEVTV